jgi:hypothetical protein
MRPRGAEAARWFWELYAALEAPLFQVLRTFPRLLRAFSGNLTFERHHHIGEFCRPTTVEMLAHRYQLP